MRGAFKSRAGRTDAGRVASRARPSTSRRRAPLRWVALLTALVALASPARSDITVDEKRDLDFGLIAAGQSTGVVTVSPFGGASCGPHTCLGGQEPAWIRVSGNKNGVYDMSYSSGDTLVHTGGGGSIPLGNFTDQVGGTLVLNPGGQGRIHIGGDLTVGPLTTGGDYSGTFTVIFNLQ